MSLFPVSSSQTREIGQSGFIYQHSPVFGRPQGPGFAIPPEPVGNRSFVDTIDQVSGKPAIEPSSALEHSLGFDGDRYLDGRRYLL